MAVETQRTGMLLIISGPSGTGKGTLVEKLMKSDPSLRFSCSVTTREPRVGEINGVHYHFVSMEEYNRLLEENAFLEHAVVHGNCYGTLRSAVEDMMAQGCNVLLDIDTQGAINVMENADDYVSIFVLPPSWSELRRRLEARNTDAQDVIERRLRTAREEVKLVDRYQYSLVNDELEPAFSQLQQIVESEKQRTHRRQYTIPE